MQPIVGDETVQTYNIFFDDFFTLLLPIFTGKEGFSKTQFFLDVVAHLVDRRCIWVQFKDVASSFDEGCAEDFGRGRHCVNVES